MKKLILIFSVFMLLFVTVDAKHRMMHRGDQDWSGSEITMELIWQGMNYIDYRQTKTIFADDEYTEKNPLVSKPTDVLWFGLAHYLLTAFLFEKENERAIWQSLSLGVKYGVISYNYFLGIRF